MIDHQTVVILISQIYLAAAPTEIFNPQVKLVRNRTFFSQAAGYSVDAAAICHP